MKNLTKYIALLTLVALFSASSCKKCHDPANPDCKNYDPCYGKIPTSATFKVYERFGNLPTTFLTDWGWVEYATDTITSNSAFFVAEDSTVDKYTWYIGLDTFHTRSVRLNDFPSNTTIPITLVTEKVPNINCFPGDDGKDSLVKYMRLIPDSLSKLNGKWHGYYQDAPQDTFTITIKHNGNIPYIYNLFPGCGSNVSTFTGYKQILISNQDPTNPFNDCGYVYGSFRIENNPNSARFDLHMRTSINVPESEIHRIFIGTRKN